MLYSRKIEVDVLNESPYVFSIIYYPYNLQYDLFYLSKLVIYLQLI